MVQYGSAAAFLAICAVAVLIIVSQSGSDSAGSGTKDAADGHQAAPGDPAARHGARRPQGEGHRWSSSETSSAPSARSSRPRSPPDLISQVVKPGDAKYEFRQFTIIGPDSVKAAKAALAAGEQNRYFNFVQLFYQNQGVENSGYVTDDFLENVAKGAGVPDLAKWNTDRNGKKVSAELKKVQADAQALGLSSTPSFVVEGPGGQQTVGSGVLSLSQLESAIKSAQ